MKIASIEPIETEKKNGQWTPKKIAIAIATALGLLGVGGTGVYGVGSAIDNKPIDKAQDEKINRAQELIDKAQDEKINRNAASIEKVYDEVIKNGRGIERLLERTGK